MLSRAGMKEKGNASAQTQKEAGIRHHSDDLIHGRNTASGLGVWGVVGRREEATYCREGCKGSRVSPLGGSLQADNQRFGAGSSLLWQEEPKNVRQRELRQSITEVKWPK